MNHTFSAEDRLHTIQETWQCSQLLRLHFSPKTPFLFMCKCLCECVTCVQYPRRPGEGLRITVIRGMVLIQWLGWNSRPVGEHNVFLIAVQLVFVCFLKQCFPPQPWLSSILVYRAGWSISYRDICCQSTEIKSIWHHAWPSFGTF